MYIGSVTGNFRPNVRVVLKRKKKKKEWISLRYKILFKNVRENKIGNFFQFNRHAREITTFLNDFE